MPSKHHVIRWLNCLQVFSIAGNLIPYILASAIQLSKLAEVNYFKKLRGAVMSNEELASNILCAWIQSEPIYFHTEFDHIHIPTVINTYKNILSEIKKLDNARPPLPHAIKG